MSRTYEPTLQGFDFHKGDRIVCRIPNGAKEPIAKVCQFSSWGVTGSYDSVAVIVPADKGHDNYLMLVQARDVLTQETAP